MRLSNYLIDNEKYLYFILLKYNLDVVHYNQQAEQLLSTHRCIIDYINKKYKILIIPYLWTISKVESQERLAFIKYYSIIIQKYNDGRGLDFLMYLYNLIDRKENIKQIPGNQYDILIFIIIVQYYFL